MKKILISLSIIPLVVMSTLVCSSETDDDDDDFVIPNMPALGTQIERMGRPAVNTALNKTFVTDTAMKNAAKDAYNAATQEDFASFATEIRGNLGIIDSLDTNCGNQFAAATPLDDMRYAALAGVLADDEVYVNTATGTCTIYLAVEANATGIITNSDCGGRTPNMDVIDTTYSVLAVGGLSGVDDDVDSDDQTHSLTAFPFLAAP